MHAELTVHSDQGWQYKMQPYRTMLARHGATQSMSRKGNRFNNAMIESFFCTLKAEYFHLVTLDSLEEFEEGVHNYINYYTSSLDCKGSAQWNIGRETPPDWRDHDRPTSGGSSSPSDPIVFGRRIECSVPRLQSHLSAWPLTDNDGSAAKAYGSTPMPRAPSSSD